jgi:pyruvate/2-oxoglutarate dehydrogenase complex dihydrolipoamide acyltransferase (E2) component
MQGITLIVDHYILDGVDILRGMRTLHKLLQTPARLGIVPEESP